MTERHGAVERVKTEVVAEVRMEDGRSANLMRLPDPEDGTPVMVRRVRNLDVIDEWYNKGRISAELYQGGADFRSDFHRVGLRGRYGRVDLARSFADGGSHLHLFVSAT